jgi:hypothetical protein
MDIDQLSKRIQWIEDERRKERDSFALLNNRITAAEGGVSAVREQIQELAGEITRLAAVVTRMDQFDNNLVQLRQDSRQQIEDLDKETKRREEEAEKVRRVDIKALDLTLNELRKEVEGIPKLEKSILARMEEENRLRRLIEETQQRIETLRRDEEDYTRTYRLLEDGRRQDAKRIVDLQGEVMALRKRGDDQRGQAELAIVNMRKIETRLNELVAVEAERRDAVASFLEKQTLTQVEREREWKEWQSRFEIVQRQAADVEAKLLTLDATQRDAKRAQGILEELTARVERRISEITEIQRLAEDRFRQEWATFKADDQKRWTNYTLTQEEQRGEISRQYERLDDRSTHLEDSLQEMEDIVQQANEESGKRLQSLLALVHEWTATYERLMGNSR